MLIKMKVAAIAEDEIFKTPIVILKALDSKDCLPIWVGPFEGQAIEYGIKGNQLLRPLPYDTTLKMLNFANVELEKIVISDLKDNTFYAVITLNKGGFIREIDSRPSDAIALAVRADIPIFVEEEIIKKAVSIDTSNLTLENNIVDNNEDDKDDIKRRKSMKILKPGDFE